MNEYNYRKGTVPCHTWRMIRALEEDLYYKRPAVPGRRPPIVMPASLTVPKAPVETAPAPQAAPVAEPAANLFDLRMERWGDELAQLYRDHFHGDLAAWDRLTTLLRQSWEARPAELAALDERRTADDGWYGRRDLLAMAVDAAGFAGSLAGVAEHLPYLAECGVNFLRLNGEGSQEELAGLAHACREREILLALPLKADAPQDAATFHTWTAGLLALANLGADAIRLGDLSRLPHDVLRMARLICELVCPGVLLMGKAPAGDQAAYFGSEDKPECHLLCRNNGALLFHTLATGDVALLRHEVEGSLSSAGLFLNRLHGDSGLDWTLDYGWLNQHCGTDEDAHRQYLNDWATGQFLGSNSRGELCQEGKVCGTTASLCGVEAADYEQNDTKLDQAVACDLLLHAFLLTQSGLPLLTCGDEVGQLNDYSYHEDPARSGDARNLQHGPFQWELAAMRGDGETRQGKQFQGLRRLEELRVAEPAFDARANVWTFDTGNPHVLGVGRWYEGRKLVALFNFGGDFVTASAPEGGAFDELVYGGHYDEIGHVELYPYGFVWLLQQEA